MTSLLRTALQGSRALTVLAGVMSGMLVVCVAGLLFDHRTVGGQPVWLKPGKFAVSLAVYGFTLAWMLAQLRRGRRAAGRAAVAIAVAAYVEYVVIAGQAARGHASHFNEATFLDEALWRGLSALATVLWVGTVVIAVLLWRDGMPDRAGTWAVRLGLLLLLAGMMQAFTMVIPTAEQIALQERGVTTMMGAHSVGVPDGGPGMPLTGWSTTGGDLRVGHFVGIHGLQAILLFSLLLPRLVDDAVRRTRLVFVFAFAYASLLVLVTWQALRGQPLHHPDGVTLTALGVMVTTAVLLAVVSWSRRTPAT